MSRPIKLIHKIHIKSQHIPNNTSDSHIQQQINERLKNSPLALETTSISLLLQQKYILPFRKYLYQSPQPLIQ